MIYGYTAIGEAVYQECERRGENVIGYCDDSQMLHRNANVKLYSLKNIIREEIEIDVFIICIARAENIVKKLSDAGFANWELAIEYLNNGNYLNDTYKMKPYKMAIKEVESCIACQKYYGMDDRLCIKSIDLEITERCSMRCRDCSNLMQYYKHPEDFTVEDLVDSIELLLKYVDEIYEIRVLGGEPFMHRNVHRIVNELLLFEQIQRVVVYTNASIMPTEEMWEVFENDKVNFNITNYGPLSRNINEMEKELQKRDIGYVIADVGKWTQCATIKKHGRNEQELKELYQECCVKNLITLLNGRLYKCPFIANAINLNAVPAYQEDFVELCALQEMEYKDARKYLRKYVLEKSFFESCDYCEGRTYDAVEIEPAIQINKPIQYKEVAGESL